jgi:hypothetical protein
MGTPAATLGCLSERVVVILFLGRAFSGARERNVRFYKGHKIITNDPYPGEMLEVDACCRLQKIIVNNASNAERVIVRTTAPGLASALRNLAQCPLFRFI